MMISSNSYVFQNGNLNQVTSLVSGLKSQSKDSDYLSRYNIILFNCLEHNQEEIAIYLIQQGMNTNIFKQVCKINFFSQNHKLIQKFDINLDI